MFCKIKKHLVPIKAHYFLYFGGMSPVYPFIPIIIRNMGFSSNIVGIIFLWLPICGMVAKTWFGALADKYKKQRFFFLLFIFLTFTCEAFILLLPSSTVNPSASLECNATGTNFNFCSRSKIAKNEKQIFLDQNEKNILCHLVCQNNNINSPYRNDLGNEADNFVLSSIKPNQSKLLPYLKQDDNNTYKSLQFDVSTFVSTDLSYEIDNCMYFDLEHATYDNVSAESLKCPEKQVFFCNMRCENAALNELWIQSMAGTRISDTDAFMMPLFWLLFFILICVSSSLAVVVIIGDAVCFKLLEGEPELFGRQRLWGSFGWGIASIVTGYLVDLVNEGKEHKNFNLLIYISIALFVLDFFTAFNIKCVQTKVSTNIFKDVGKLLKDPRLVVFVSWCIITGLLSALVWNFLFLYIEDLATNLDSEEYLMTKTLQGLVIGAQSIGGEVPFFFLSGTILKRIGHINAMSLVLAAFSARLYLISLVVNPWYVLPIELLNGLTYGLLTSTMNSYASIVAPPGTESTMQGLVGAIFEGVGVSVGSYICGNLFDVYGGRVVFQAFAALAAVGFVLHVLIQSLIRLRRHSKGYREPGKPLKEGITNEGLQLQ